VFAGLCRRISYYVDIPRPEAPGVTATLALRVVLTYCYQVWPAVPYLHIGGPLGRGKSRVFDVLSRLVFRPLASSSMTGPTLFRTLHTSGGTLLLDEAERLRDTRDPTTGEIVGMLLAGYHRGATATRLEPVGENGFKTVSFEVYGPKALACIAGLPPALASRAIPIVMFRAAPGSEKPKRGIDADPGGWQSLRDGLHTLALEHGTDFLAMPERSDVCPPGIDGRQYELWQPLLALSAWVEEAGARGLLELLQEHALQTIDAAQEEQIDDTDEALLRILAEKRRNLETPQAKDILAEAQAAEPNVFKRWTAKGVANALRRYGIRTNTYLGRKVYGKVTLGDLRRIGSVYGMALGLPEGDGESEG
jgi:hypothetical protein